MKKAFTLAELLIFFIIVSIIITVIISLFKPKQIIEEKSVKYKYATVMANLDEAALTIVNDGENNPFNQSRDYDAFMKMCEGLQKIYNTTDERSCKAYFDPYLTEESVKWNFNTSSTGVLNDITAFNKIDNSLKNKFLRLFDYASDLANNFTPKAFAERTSAAWDSPTDTVCYTNVKGVAVYDPLDVSYGGPLQCSLPFELSDYLTTREYNEFITVGNKPPGVSLIFGAPYACQYGFSAYHLPRYGNITATKNEHCREVSNPENGGGGTGSTINCPDGYDYKLTCPVAEVAHCLPITGDITNYYCSNYVTPKVGGNTYTFDSSKFSSIDEANNLLNINTGTIDSDGCSCTVRYNCTFSCVPKTEDLIPDPPPDPPVPTSKIPIITAVNGMDFYLTQLLKTDDGTKFFIVLVNINANNGSRKEQKLTYDGRNIPDVFAFALLENGSAIPLGAPEVDMRFLEAYVNYKDLATLKTKSTSNMPYYKAKNKAWGFYSNEVAPSVNNSIGFSYNDSIQKILKDNNSKLYDNVSFETIPSDAFRNNYCKPREGKGENNYSRCLIKLQDYFL